jgi:O-antigen ligase
MSLAILASLSRGGILSLAAGALLLLWIRRSTRRSARGSDRSRFGLPVGLFALGLGGSVLFALLPREAKERTLGITTAASEQSGSFRLDTWRDSIRLAASSPALGHGLGAFVEAFPRVKRAHGELRVEHAESDVLETLAETGLVGLGLWALALILLTRSVLAGLRQRSPGSERGADRVRRGIGAGALAAVLALAVHSAFDFNLRIPSNAALLALAAALAVGSAAASLTGPPLPGQRARDLLAGGLLLGAIAWCLQIPIAAAPAGREDVALAASIRRPEARALRLERAESALAASLKHRPADAESWYLLAWTRAARGRDREALDLARHARSLDPARTNLGEAIARLEKALASRDVLPEAGR